MVRNRMSSWPPGLDASEMIFGLRPPLSGNAGLQVGILIGGSGPGGTLQLMPECSGFMGVGELRGVVGRSAELQGYLGFMHRAEGSGL